MATDDDNGIGAVTFRAFLLGVLLAGLFAWVTAVRDNFPPFTFLSANLIPVMPHVMLLSAGLLINPLLKRVRVIRPFSKAELLLIFVMCAVSSGIATFGLSGKLVPTVAGLSNSAWNTDQSQWDAQVMPFLNENYFIAAKGSQEAAKQLREVHLEYEKARQLYRGARDLQLGKAELARIEADLKQIAATTDPDERAARERAMVWPHGQAVRLVELATEEWEAIGGGLDPQRVVESYAGKIAGLKAERDALRKGLKALNQDASEAVEQIRKGLPPEKRAIPGFFYTAGEGFASYSARIRRLRVGRASLRRVSGAETLLAKAIEDDAPLANDWSADVRNAAAMLEPISDIPALSALDAKLSAQLAEVEGRLAEQRAEGRRLRDLRRYSKQSQFDVFNDKIGEIESSSAELEKRAETLRARVDNQIKPLLAVCARVRETQAALVGLADDADGAAKEAYPELQTRLLTSMSAYAGFDAALRRFWLGDAQWGLWLRPVTNWLVLVFMTYLVLMSFNTLIFRQWAHNEKLIYPLAEITTLLAGGAKSTNGEKALFRSGLFWTGFTVSAGILGWNYLATNHIIPNINPVELEIRWYSYVGSGLMKGLASTYFCIIFAVIGITFLVPSSISFSLWFFEILYMGLLLVMVWLGYGSNRWSLGNVGRSGLGAGAMLIFGATILWTCRRYLLCAFSPDVLKGLQGDERKELRVSSALFLGGSLALILMLTWGLGANLFFVILFYLIMMATTIALIRAVAEGGVLGLESFASAFGILKTLFGMTKAWCAPILVAPLLIYSAITFGSFKAFIAPMMANALKVREQFRMRRLYFHGAIWAGILVAVLVSVATLIILSYQHGADNLNVWLNTASARGVFDSVKAWVESTKPVKPSDRWWMLAGAVLMGALLFSRRRVFGVPHPIGLLMLMNPVMFGFWGSILIGWLFKSLVSKYCSHEQYVSIRRFFVGLVLGHLVAVLFGWERLEFHWG